MTGPGNKIFHGTIAFKQIKNISTIYTKFHMPVYLLYKTDTSIDYKNNYGYISCIWHKEKSCSTRTFQHVRRYTWQHFVQPQEFSDTLYIYQTPISILQSEIMLFMSDLKITKYFLSYSDLDVHVCWVVQHTQERRNPQPVHRVIVCSSGMTSSVINNLPKLIFLIHVHKNGTYHTSNAVNNNHDNLHITWHHFPEYKKLIDLYSTENFQTSTTFLLGFNRQKVIASFSHSTPSVLHPSPSLYLLNREKSGNNFRL